MIVRFVSLTALISALTPSTLVVEAQGDGRQMQQCSMTRVMQWLSIAARTTSGPQDDTSSMRTADPFWRSPFSVVMVGEASRA